MQVKILAFGVLKDWLGSSAMSVVLPEGARVSDLLSQLAAHKRGPSSSDPFRGIAVSVNAEYAQPAQVLHDGDEVGLLPPVSGGALPMADAVGEMERQPAVITALTSEPIETHNLVEAAKRGPDGAVVVFDGIVRDNSRGRQTLYLDYEAYEEMARRQINELALDAISRFGIRHVTLVHRLGRLAVGETSVLIVVASAHRAQAFDACRWLIDTLKKTVPIWKKETFADGSVWAAGEPFPDEISATGAEAAHGS